MTARRGSRFAASGTAALLGAALLSGAASPASGATASGSAGRTAGAAGPVTAPGSHREWAITTHPFGMTFTDHGRTVTAEAGGATTGPGGRLSYQVGGDVTTDAGARDYRVTDLISQRRVPGGDAYTVATSEPGRTATITVTRTPGGARVAWSLHPASGVTAVFEALTAGPAEHYLGGSSAAYVDLRGHIRGWSPGKEGDEAGEYCQNQEQSAAPFYLSSGGYGFYADTSHVGRFAFPGATQVADGPTCARTPRPPTGDPDPYPCPVADTPRSDRVQVCVMDDHLSYDVFYGSPARVTTDYYQRTGLPALPPPSEFGLMKWRDVNADQAQVLADVAEFKKLGIPITTIWVDNPWERQPPGNLDRANGSACNGSLEFDPTFFPHPEQMIEAIHAEGVKFGLWVSPIESSPSASHGGGSCAGINDVWSRNGWLIPGTNYIDFSNPAARAYYIAKLTKLFRLGVNMAKEDRGEEFRLQTAQLAGGPGASLYLRYPVLYHSAVTQALRAANGSDFETLVRAGAPGDPAVTHGMWGSDTYQTFGGLRAEVRYGISEPLGGGSFAWGSDTGGIDPESPANATDSPTPVLFDRWAQFSAVSPVFEVGGAGLNATPWEYPAWTVSDFRDSAVLHYELFPYLYGLAEQAARTGVPILRAVGYQYPHDPAAWRQDQEFMIGPDLLAAPVTADRAQADGAAGKPTPVSVYLPAGRWINLFSGQAVRGGRTVVDEAGLDEFPLYLRAGAAIGFNARTPDMWAHGWGADDLSKAGYAGWMYAPGAAGPEGTGAAAGAGSSVGAGSSATLAISSGAGTLSASAAGGRVRLTLRGAPPHAQVLVLASCAPRAVTVDGRPLPHAGSAAALRSAVQGWTFSSGAFGGVLVKLSPRHGAATVGLSLG
jgi:alpha-glucosidase (family GH31 glycosyl hydrolase)